MIASFASLFSAHAATSELHYIFVADFENGWYYGAMENLDGDSWKAIKFHAVTEVTQEDMFPSYAAVITANVSLDERSNTMTAYSAEYNSSIDLEYTLLDDSDIGTISDLDNSGTIQYAKVNGDNAQLTGFAVNGAMFLLREANAYSTMGTGWMLQNGNLISYAVSNGEENTPNNTIYVPVVSN